ncbi:MAG: GNAT family N-acetyltransferase [Actinomycetota bacterium]
MSPGTAEVVVRRATAGDRPEILAVAGRSLGWEPGPATEAHFTWKHADNPFGASPMWVAEVGGRVAGFRTFLRWEFLHAGEVRHAVRAVDTATDPEFQGRGIFTTLTRAALDELTAEGVDFVFNTPNAQSRPGYLKMGWVVVGRLPVVVRPAGPGGLLRIARARTPADRGAVPTAAGTPAATVFADRGLAERLLTHVPPGAGLTTRRSVEYLRWRFGPEALHYRVVAGPEGPEAGAVVFHLRRRGPALEAVICETLVPAGDARTRAAAFARISEESGADYLLALRSPRPPGRRFWPVPGAGPVLTSRVLATAPPAARADWHLGLGDVELF